MIGRDPARDIYIGVDGGATKTVARVESAAGELLGQGRGGAANIRLSVEGSWRSILEAVEQALAEAGLGLASDGHRFHLGAGLAGTEVCSAREAFLNTPHPFSRLLLKSDAYTSCLGAHDGADGAVIAIGTGTVAYQIESGRETQISGWGFPHGDEGSGAWLGLEAIRLTLQWRDGRQPGCPLLEAVYAHFDQDLARLVAWANQATATQFAQITPLVVEQANRGVPLALALMRRAAAEIDRIGEALSAASTHPLPCCLQGGMAPFIEPFLGAALRERLVPKRADAVRGALLMIRRAVQPSFNRTNRS